MGGVGPGTIAARAQGAEKVVAVTTLGNNFCVGTNIVNSRTWGLYVDLNICETLDLSPGNLEHFDRALFWGSPSLWGHRERAKPRCRNMLFDGDELREILLEDTVSLLERRVKERDG